MSALLGEMPSAGHYRILAFFNNRNTNAHAESLNAQIKLFRANLRGVSIPLVGQSRAIPTPQSMATESTTRLSFDI